MTMSCLCWFSGCRSGDFSSSVQTRRMLPYCVWKFVSKRYERLGGLSPGHRRLRETYVVMGEDQLFMKAFRSIVLDEKVPVFVHHGLELGPFYTTHKL